MKKFAKLIPAMAMLLISAILVSTSTFAWFSMNTNVTATGMQVKAVAEDGIVIADATKIPWTASANATVGSATSLLPTSTNNCTVWYHNSSTEADNANQAQTGQTGWTGSALSGISYSDTTTNTGVAYIKSSQESDGYTVGVDKAYYLYNAYYVKSSGDVIGSSESPATFYINSVTLESDAAKPLDCALRVGVKVSGDNNLYIFAPVSQLKIGDTTYNPSVSYYVGAGTSATSPRISVTSSNETTIKNVKTTIDSIGNTDDTAVKIEVYIWYEGEDVNCKSTNISGIDLDTLGVTIRFGTTAID